MKVWNEIDYDSQIWIDDLRNAAELSRLNANVGESQNIWLRQPRRFRCTIQWFYIYVKVPPSSSKLSIKRVSYFNRSQGSYGHKFL